MSVMDDRTRDLGEAQAEHDDLPVDVRVARLVDDACALYAHYWHERNDAGTRRHEQGYTRANMAMEHLYDVVQHLWQQRGDDDGWQIKRDGFDLPRRVPTEDIPF